MMFLSKRIILTLSALLLSFAGLYAQDINFFGDTIKKKRPIVVVPSGLPREQEICRKIGQRFPVPVIDYNPNREKPKFWTTGVLDEIGFSQISLTNWAAGGSGSVALNAYVNAMANYDKGKLYWYNRIQLSYGFVQNFDVGYRKADDKIILDSKFGYQAYRKLYFSSAFNFKSQFSPGFTYDKNNKATMVSKCLAPAYVTLALGMDYKPGNGKVLSISLSPLTGSVVIVDADSTIRVKYGNDYDKLLRWELGAQLKVVFNKNFAKDFNVASQFSLFSDYMGKAANMLVSWDVQATYSINKFLKTSLRTNFLYDDKVKIASKDGSLHKRAQFKEVFGVNFSYTIGQYKK